MKKIYLLVFTFIFSYSFSQNIVLNNNNQVTFNCANTGNLVNPGGANYAPGVQIVKTICTNGDPFSVELIAANFGDIGDFLCIYDGIGTTAPLIACFTSVSGQLPGFQVRTSLANASGCLTFQFTSAVTSPGGNFSFEMDCLPACKSVAVAIDSTSPIANNTFINNCKTDTVSFFGTGVYDTNLSGYAQSDLTSRFFWDFGDGTLDTAQNPKHVYPAGSVYVVNLTVEDVNGCRSTNGINLKVIQNPELDILFNPPTSKICLGDTTSLVGYLDGFIIGDSAILDTITGQSSASVQDTVFLPDDSDNISGNGNTTPVVYPLDIFGYLPGATLTGASDILSVCVEMEHSFVGDLDIRLVCPNGQSMDLVDFSPPGTPGNDLGIPGTAVVPGTGFEYCWSPTSTSGSIAVGQPSLNNTPILAGTYQAVDSWNSLAGCPFNGEWSIQVFDDYGGDDGWCFGASIALNPAFLLPVDTFFIFYDNPVWNANPNIITNLNDTIVSVISDDFNSDTYFFSVTNNLGCTYTDSVNVDVFDLNVVPVGDGTFCLGDTIQLGLNYEGTEVFLPAVCNYNIELQDSWGDGWNGAFLNVTVDGVTQQIAFTGTTGSPAGGLLSVDIPVPNGASFSVVYVRNFAGFPTEQYFEVNDPNGNLIFSAGSVPCFECLDDDGANPIPDQTTYSTLVACPGGPQGPPRFDVVASVADVDTICDISLVRFDSWGDGWTNATVSVTINGTSQGSFGVADQGLILTEISETTDFSVSLGDVVNFVYNTNGELFATEPSFDVIDANGNVLFASVNGPANGTSFSVTINDLSACQTQEYVISDWMNGTFNENYTGTQTTADWVVNSSGTFTALTTFSNGCSYESEFEIEALIFNYQLSNDTAICEGDNAILTASGASTYLWTPNNGTLSSLNTATTVASPTTTTTYFVEFNTALCPGVDSVTVTVNQSPVPLINDNLGAYSFCSNEDFLLTTQNFPNWTYEWLDEQNQSLGSFPTYVADEGGTYTLSVVDANGCSGNALVLLSEEPFPLYDFQNLRNILCCSNDEIQVDVNNFITNFNSLVVDQILINGSSSNPFTVESGDNSSYEITVITDFGCEASETISFITNCINPAITSPDSIFSNTENAVSVTNESNNVTSTYAWSPETLFLNPSTQNTSIITDLRDSFFDIFVNVTQSYTLNDGTLYTCSESDSALIYSVFVGDPILPNAFTPNGDGLNEKFYPLDVDNFSKIAVFNIYDRWGKLIYDYSMDASGWDGNIDGVKQNADTYSYYLVVEKPDGNYVTSGTFTLIR